MARPRVYLVGIAALVMIFLVAIRPDAYPAERGLVLANAPVPASLPRVLGSCPAVELREAYEEADCLQAVRKALLAGEIELAEAVVRLRSCAIARSDLADLGERAFLADFERLAGRVGFGEALPDAEAVRLDDLGAYLEREPEAPSANVVRRLAAAGITSRGFADGLGPRIVERLRTDNALRADFRAAFGDVRANALEALLSDEIPAGTPAVTVGATTIIPNRPAVYATTGGTLAFENQDGETLGGAVTVATAAYEARLLADLVALEAARQRYLESAARLYQHTGSVRVFLVSVRSIGDESNIHEDLRAVAERDRAILAARLANLDRRMGADPLLYRMAGESVGIVTEINEGCRSVAERRQRWIRTGAGMVTGLVGAAGVVVVTGATGTLIGGVTIAAALEASVGAFLIARSEQIGTTAISAEAPAPETPEELRAPEPPPAREISDDTDLDDTPVEGGFEAELAYDDFGEPRDLGLEVGEEGDEPDEEEDSESTEAAPRENTIPPVLPAEIPEALRELPPLLDTDQIRALRELTLPEIQERLDDFLAGENPASWMQIARDEEVALWSSEQMLSEAEAALELWENRRELASTFGEFFIQAETENLAAQRRGETLLRAMGRYIDDRSLYAHSRSVDDLRQRLAARLVSHCRAGAAVGDLALVACADETALSVLLIAALRDAGIEPPAGSIVGVQVFGPRFEAVLYSREQNRVFSLTRGGEMEGVIAPIYHPAAFYYTYLVAHGVYPQIDLDRHLLVALPDRPMPVEIAEVEACIGADEKPGLISRAVSWLASLVGVRRVETNPCDPEAVEQARTARRGGDRSIDLSIPSPIRNPLQGGSGQNGGGSGQGGGGGGGGNPLSGNEPGDPMSSGGSGGGEGSGGGASDAGKGQGTGSAESEAGEGAEGSGAGSAAEGAGGAAEGGRGTDAEAGAAAASGEQGAGGGAGSSGASGAPTGGGGDGEGGYAAGGFSIPDGPNLTRIGRETSRAAEQYEQAPDLGIMPWRLRDDQGMLTGSTTRVLWADNARALERFGDDDLFITLAPAEVEAQRRMLEADAFPILGADATCESAQLPPRRVFRREAPGDPGYRYVFCDHDESMVIFRAREHADSYSRLNAPDRPLFLARLASERIDRFEKSEEVVRLLEYMADPNVVRSWSREEAMATVKAAADLVVFQDALESALVQSMNELGPSEARGYYYDMHRQVIQAPFFIQIAEAAYLLNKRLASDPLQSLAWTNAQEAPARQAFFDLYFTVGSFMEWPTRWATLQERYGIDGGAIPAEEPGTASLDFLQVLSDPVRVRVDWNAERSGNPSIRDRQTRDGVERADEEVAAATAATERNRQNEIKHLKAGTEGAGRAGEGELSGPESGRRPLQMVRIRVVPDVGPPREIRENPEENQILPGGTRGRERRNTEESASRQEPVLWVSPSTFVEAVLSNWDSRDLRPESADRVPPILRFNERLREVYLRDLRPAGVYDNRLRAAMEVFARGDWLRYQEVREAMGGSLAAVKAIDTRRFSGAYSGNAPINDQDQIRIPNFFRQDGVVIPGDLFDPVRDHYTRAVLGIFDLESLAGVPPAWQLSALPNPSADRDQLLETLERIVKSEE